LRGKLWVAAVTPFQTLGWLAATNSAMPRGSGLPKANETPNGASHPLQHGCTAEAATTTLAIQVNLQRLSTRRIEKPGGRGMIDTPSVIPPKIPPEISLS
jgi:sirohydrochlorin ferrochelatase